MRHHAFAITLIAGLCGPFAPALALPGDAPAASPTKGRVLDAKAAQAVGFAPGWQSQLPLLPGTSVQGVRLEAAADGKPENEVIYAWDMAGVIMRLDARSGDVRWTSTGVMQGSRTGLIDVLTAPVRGGEVTVGLGDVNCLVLDARSGTEQGLSPYTRIPVTPAVRTGDDVAYVSRAGQVVWMAFREEAIPSRKESRPGDPVSKTQEVAAKHVIPLELRAHELKGAITVPPVVAGRHLIACSTQGHVACFTPDGKRLEWQLRLPGGVVAAPAAADTQVFIACRDQYLRCVQLAPTVRAGAAGEPPKKMGAGAVAWKWFTETPLERPPFVSGDRVVIQVPGMGLVALDANPANVSMTRQPLWVSKASGDGITRTGDGLLTWDADSHTLSLVDTDTGAVRDSRALPDVVMLCASAPTNGDLLMLTTDGRVQRCPPLNPVQVAKPAAPAAPAADKPASQPGTTEAAPAPTADAPAAGGN